ncbi:MAG TPA: hypothetical protein VLA76_07505 [Candidatus Angelobacter sp.]|nr:hypothetical protein [Candidatus Angelobacter sp.]
MSITRHTLAVLVGAMLLTALTAGPAVAKGPIGLAVPQPEPELTAAEEAASAAKIAAAEAYLASKDVRAADLVSLACVTPNGGSLDASTQAGCTTPYATLSVEARDQVKSYYCGPAVGQVIANYAWAVGAGANKYSQATIAGWMKTDINGYTNASELVAGLEAGTRNAPRRPAGWVWVITRLTDTDRDGLFADQLHGYVRASVSNSRMPLAVPVKPHDRNSQYRLSSWPRPVASPGHWIALYGWYATWTNSDTPQLAYTDSSRDEGGSTGKFWDPTRHISALIMEHTQRFVW